MLSLGPHQHWIDNRLLRRHLSVRSRTLHLLYPTNLVPSFTKTQWRSSSKRTMASWTFQHPYQHFRTHVYNFHDHLATFPDILASNKGYDELRSTCMVCICCHRFDRLLH